MLLKIWVSKSHVKSKQHSERLERKKKHWWMNKNIFIQLLHVFFPGSALWARFGGPAGELSGAALWVLRVFHVPTLSSQGNTEKAAKSWQVPWPSCTPREHTHALLQKPCCSPGWGMLSRSPDSYSYADFAAKTQIPTWEPERKRCYPVVVPRASVCY